MQSPGPSPARVQGSGKGPTVSHLTAPPRQCPRDTPARLFYKVGGTEALPGQSLRPELEIAKGDGPGAPSHSPRRTAGSGRCTRWDYISTKAWCPDPDQGPDRWPRKPVQDRKLLTHASPRGDPSRASLSRGPPPTVALGLQSVCVPGPTPDPARHSRPCGCTPAAPWPTSATESEDKRAVAGRSLSEN